jgi:predicted nucleic acid-binding protein
MTVLWADTSVLVRYLTKDPPSLAARARALMARAAAGEARIRIPSVVVAEVVWVLTSYYELDTTAVAGAVGDLIASDGVEAEDRDVLLDALRVMRETNVSFVDAYLAERARSAAEPLATFDKGFRRLGVEIVTP